MNHGCWYNTNIPDICGQDKELTSFMNYWSKNRYHQEILMKWIQRKPDNDVNKSCMIFETPGFIARLMFVKHLSNSPLGLLFWDGASIPNATNWGRVFVPPSTARFVRSYDSKMIYTLIFILIYYLEVEYGMITPYLTNKYFHRNLL